MSDVLEEVPVIGGRSFQIPTWVTDALSRVPLPDAPVRTPWVFAPSALITPYLPGPLRQVPSLLDRLGAVRLTPDEISIDSARPVPWRDVVELRTRPLLDVFTVGTSDNLSGLVARLLPPVPFVKGQLVNLGTEKVAEAVRAILLIAVREHAQKAASVQVPTEIVYRAGWRRRSNTMTAGLLSSAVLALPTVTASVLATARQHAVPITTPPPSGSCPTAQDSESPGRYQRAALTRRPIENSSADDGPRPADAR